MKKKLFNEIRKVNEFERDFKKLLKNFKTLDEDLDNFINVQLNLAHKLNIIDKKSIVRISNLGINEPKIYKARKFACKALKGKGGFSGIRIIYAYYEEEDIIEFIEIYYKGEKANEDRDRILRYYSQKEAEKAAKKMLKNQGGGELTTAVRDRKFRSKDTIKPVIYK